MKETAQSNLVGTLTREESYDYWRSEPVRVSFFDEQQVPAVYNCDPLKDPSFISEADSDLGNFLAKSREERDPISERVFQICNDFMELVGLRDGIELYKSVETPESWMVRIIEKQGPLLELKSPRDIWRFVHPRELHLVRETHNGETNMYVQVLCETDWNEEEGLQIVFRHGVQLVGVAVQDGDVCIEF